MMKIWTGFLLLACSLPAQELQVAATLAFNEGPAADASGNMFFTETITKRIMKLSADGQLTTFRDNTNIANGLIFDNEGRLIACEGGKDRPRVTRTDVGTMKVETLAETFEGQPLHGPNDVTLDAQGRIYFTDPTPGIGKDAVYRIDRNGKLSRLLSGKDIEQPNGIMISPDDRTLYLVESNGAERGARMIRAYDLQPDGTLRNMRVFHNFYPGRSADGLCIDSQGSLYAAAGLNRRRGTHETLDTKPGVHIFSSSGKLLNLIPIPEDTITNCAFGGPDLKTLYITAGKTLFKVPVEVPGTRR